MRTVAEVPDLPPEDALDCGWMSLAPETQAAIEAAARCPCRTSPCQCPPRADQPTPATHDASCPTCGGWYPGSEYGADAHAEWAGEPEPGIDTPTAEYAEVWDDSVAPGGYVCSVCRQPVESEPCAEHSGPDTTPPPAASPSGCVCPPGSPLHFDACPPSSTELDTAAMRARADAAVAGPWTWGVTNDRKWARVYRPGSELDEPTVAQLADDDNAEFVAHARTDIPALLDALDEARAALRAATAELADAWDEGWDAGWSYGTETQHENPYRRGGGA